MVYTNPNSYAPNDGVPRHPDTLRPNHDSAERRIGNEAPLLIEGNLQTSDQNVHRINQGPHLPRHSLDGEGFLAIDAAIGDSLRKLRQSSHYAAERPPNDEPGQWNDDQDRRGCSDRGALGELLSNDHALCDLYGPAAVAQCVDAPLFTACRNCRKARTFLKRNLYSAGRTPDFLSRGIPYLDSELVLRIVVCRGRRIGRQSLASVERDLT